MIFAMAIIKDDYNWKKNAFGKLSYDRNSTIHERTRQQRVLQTKYHPILTSTPPKLCWKLSGHNREDR